MVGPYPLPQPVCEFQMVTSELRQASSKSKGARYPPGADDQRLAGSVPGARSRWDHHTDCRHVFRFDEAEPLLVNDWDT